MSSYNLSEILGSIIKEIDADANAQTYRTVVRMILERLLVVDGRLNGHRAVDEESVAYFHTRHQIVVA